MSFESWKREPLDKFVKFQRGFDLPKDNFVEGDIPVYGSTSILGYHNQIKVKAPGVITGRSGTLGKFQYAKNDFWPHNTTLWVKDFMGNDPKFVYYSLQCLDFSDFNSGGAVPTLNRNVLKSFKMDIPPLPIQKKIATILSNYDDLIENNLKQIKLLEEKARLTYEEWFLRFRIDGQKLKINEETGLPFGWEKQRLESLINYHIGGGWGEEEQSNEFSEPAFVIRGTDFNNVQLGSLENVPHRYHKSSNLSSRNLKHKDIIFEVSGGSSTEGVAKTLQLNKILLDQFDNQVMCASFCKLVRTKSEDYSNLLFLFFQYLRDIRGTEVYELRSASNIVNYNWSAFLKFQETIIPDIETIKLFNLKIDPIIEGIYNLAKQNNLLKESRDILLPRLMTGMIDVDNLDIEV